MNARRDDDRHFLPETDPSQRYLLRAEWVEARARIEDKFADQKDRIQRIESVCADGTRKTEENFKDRYARLEADLGEGRRAHERLHQEVETLSMLIRVRAGQLAIAVSFILATLSLLGPRLVEWIWPS